MMRIPKIIHYVWLGKGNHNELMEKCINSWKTILPDYEIKEWNEDNFDINSNDYLKEAYNNKKYAFASDYIRLAVLYKYGGIYMDTDVEILKPLDEFLNLPAFSGFESNENIPTGLMASEKHGKWIKYLLEDYKDAHFVNSDGSFDLTTNVIRITNKTITKYDFKKNNKYQDLGDVVFFPSDYFCPKNCVTGIIELTSNSHAIHHFNGSWLPKNEKKFIEDRRKFVLKYGEEKGIKIHERILKIKSIKYLPKRIINWLCHPVKYLKKLKQKIVGD